jgi:hypothetical protein
MSNRDLSCEPVYKSCRNAVHSCAPRLPIMQATTTEREQENGQLVNPCRSPSITDPGNEQYKYAQYLV